MPSLEELKKSRDSLQRLFAVLMQGTYSGQIVEHVGDAKKFVDGVYTQVEADIKALEAEKPSFTEEVQAKVAEAGLAELKENAVESSQPAVSAE